MKYKISFNTMTDSFVKGIYEHLDDALLRWAELMEALDRGPVEGAEIFKGEYVKGGLSDEDLAKCEVSVDFEIWDGADGEEELVDDATMPFTCLTYGADDEYYDYIRKRMRMKKGKGDEAALLRFIHEGGKTQWPF